MYVCVCVYIYFMPAENMFLPILLSTLQLYSDPNLHVSDSVSVFAFSVSVSQSGIVFLCLFVCLSICRCLPVSLSVPLFVCLSVHLSLSLSLPLFPLFSLSSFLVFLLCPNLAPFTLSFLCRLNKFLWCVQSIGSMSDWRKIGSFALSLSVKRMEPTI